MRAEHGFDVEQQFLLVDPLSGIAVNQQRVLVGPFFEAERWLHRALPPVPALLEFLPVLWGHVRVPVLWIPRVVGTVGLQPCLAEHHGDGPQRGQLRDRMQKPPGRPPVVSVETRRLKREVGQVSEELPVVKIVRRERISDVLELLDGDVDSVHGGAIRPVGHHDDAAVAVSCARKRQLGPELG